MQKDWHASCFLNFCMICICTSTVFDPLLKNNYTRCFTMCDGIHRSAVDHGCLRCKWEWVVNWNCQLKVNSKREVIHPVGLPVKQHKWLVLLWHPKTGWKQNLHRNFIYECWRHWHRQVLSTVAVCFRTTAVKKGLANPVYQRSKPWKCWLRRWDTTMQEQTLILQKMNWLWLAVEYVTCLPVVVVHLESM